MRFCRTLLHIIFIADVRTVRQRMSTSWLLGFKVDISKKTSTTPITSTTSMAASHSTFIFFIWPFLQNVSNVLTSLDPFDTPIRFPRFQGATYLLPGYLPDQLLLYAHVKQSASPPNTAATKIASSNRIALISPPAAKIIAAMPNIPEMQYRIATVCF